jgi:hypothetical protein
MVNGGHGELEAAGSESCDGEVTTFSTHEDGRQDHQEQENLHTQIVAPIALKAILRYQVAVATPLK